jgi:hypothetical protein
MDTKLAVVRLNVASLRRCESGASGARFLSAFCFFSRTTRGYAAGLEELLIASGACADSRRSMAVFVSQKTVYGNTAEMKWSVLRGLPVDELQGRSC